MSALDDAAELAKHLRDIMVDWPGVASGSRQTGTTTESRIDILTDDDRLFVLTVRYHR